MNNRRSLAGVLALAIACGISASALGDLYTVRIEDGMLRKLDTTNLTFQDIGILGVPFDFGGLSYDPVSQQMYMVQGFDGTGLYTVDLNNGAASFVGTHGFDEMFSLAYDPTSDTMYSGLSTADTGFYDMDLGNGQANFVGDPGFNIDGMTYDPVRGNIVGALAGPGDLYEFNPNTGQGNLLHDGDFFDNGGLSYDADTDLLWFIDWSGDLYTFDPDNGYQRTLVMSGLGAHDGLASTVIPAPGALALLGLGALAGGRRRRR